MKKINNVMKVKTLAFMSMGVVPFLGFSVGSDSENEEIRVEQPVEVNNEINPNALEELTRKSLIIFIICLNNLQSSEINLNNETLMSKTYSEIIDLAKAKGLNVDLVKQIAKDQPEGNIDIEIKSLQKKLY